MGSCIARELGLLDHTAHRDLDSELLARMPVTKGPARDMPFQSWIPRTGARVWLVKPRRMKQVNVLPCQLSSFQSHRIETRSSCRRLRTVCSGPTTRNDCGSESHGSMDQKN